MSSRWCSLVVAGAMPVMAACYAYVPVDTSVSAPVGRRVALDITDRGRVGLSDRLGSGVLRLEGTVTQRDSSQYVMQLWRVAQLTGENAQWSGETVRINRDYVGGVRERKLSRGKSYLAAGVAAAALYLIGKNQGLFGKGDPSTVDNPPPPGPASSRGWY